MLGIHDYWLFVISGIALNVAPGQDTLYIAGRSIAEGRNAGFAAALGVGTGGLVHVTGATLGLSAILATSPLAYACVQWLGVAYLAYLGVMLISAREGLSHASASATGSIGWGTAYRRGILTNVLNPKVALFFLAYLPQFVDPGTTHRALSFMALGMTFLFTGMIWCLILVLVFSRVSATVRRSPRGGMLARRIAGTVFIGLAIRIALEGVRR